VTVVADSGAIYALIDASDAWHARVMRWWQANTLGVVLPVTVLPEVTYLLHQRIGTAAEAAFVRAVADDEFVVEPLEPEDITRATGLLHEYADLPLGFVDATVVAIVERLDARAVLTTDRRHFAVVRSRHARPLALLP
jgi:predicted nucleic acid-binding protein